MSLGAVMAAGLWGVSQMGVCVVTGVGPGNGLAIVRRFARQGYQVAMLARNAQRLELSLIHI